MTAISSRAKRVSFLELFFDLAFVFAVTQLVHLLQHDRNAAGWGHSALMLWLVWWAWSQYAWTGNAVDLEPRRARLWMLAATGAVLLAASAIPEAFGASGAWFALPYAAVRVVGLGLYWFGLAGERDHQAALRSYLPVQCLSPVLVVVGGVYAPARIWLWTIAVVVDVVSVAAAGRGEFRVDVAHFAERHGLIVIIAIGESVIDIGATTAEVGLDGARTALLVVAFTAVAALWWCYFDWVHPAAEARLARETDHRRRGRLARDLFTLGHLPIIAGIVVLAAAVETVIEHPTDRLDAFGVSTLAIGPGLFLLGFVVGNLRATGRLLWTRALGVAAIAAGAIVAGRAGNALVAVTVVTGVLVAVAAVESHQHPTAPEQRQPAG